MLIKVDIVRGIISTLDNTVMIMSQQLDLDICKKDYIYLLLKIPTLVNFQMLVFDIFQAFKLSGFVLPPNCLLLYVLAICKQTFGYVPVLGKDCLLYLVD